MSKDYCESTTQAENPTDHYWAKKRAQQAKTSGLHAESLGLAPGTYCGPLSIANIISQQQVQII